jgi:p21-activated kinase 1
VAVKQMYISRSTKFADLENEIAMMKLSHHPNIVHCLDTYMWDSQLWIMMEMLPEGSLKSVTNRFATNNLRFDTSLIAFVCQEVVTGLQFLHELGRIHRDIKSENILIGHAGAVKLADFGYCVQVYFDTVRSLPTRH